MSPRRPAGVHGLVVVDKPAGMTSHDVVGRCRRVFDQRQVGHAGTLDPSATGVLLVGLGAATRLLRFLSVLPKSYLGEVVLGAATSTLDADGDVVATFDMAGVTLDQVREAAAALVGDILQVPPMVSAVKVGGRRLHELARAGEEVERAPRPVTVFRFDVEPTGAPGVLRVAVECSSGTYVRSLAADLGRALGGGAHLRALRRTAVGPFTAAAAVALDDVGPATVRPPAAAVAHLPRVAVGPELAARIAHGAVLERDEAAFGGDGPWAVVDGGGTLLAVYEGRGDHHAKPAVVVAGG
ncbi:MAG: tRNA pseudouridine(55) synthase TruB [Acidimicrobiales bacterium]